MKKCISPGSVVTHLRCGGIFNDDFIAKFITKSAGERTSKIGQRLAKLDKNIVAYDSQGTYEQEIKYNFSSAAQVSSTIKTQQLRGRYR